MYFCFQYYLTYILLCLYSSQNVAAVAPAPAPGSSSPEAATYSGLVASIEQLDRNVWDRDPTTDPPVAPPAVVSAKICDIDEGCVILLLAFERRDGQNRLDEPPFSLYNIKYESHHITLEQWRESYQGRVRSEFSSLWQFYTEPKSVYYHADGKIDRDRSRQVGRARGAAHYGRRGNQGWRSLDVSSSTSRR